jgi:hypothetical protein
MAKSPIVRLVLTISTTSVGRSRKPARAWTGVSTICPASLCIELLLEVRGSTTTDRRKIGSGAQELIRGWMKLQLLRNSRIAGRARAYAYRRLRPREAVRFRIHHREMAATCVYRLLTCRSESHIPWWSIRPCVAGDSRCRERFRPLVVDGCGPRSKRCAISRGVAAV